MTPQAGDHYAHPIDDPDLTPHPLVSTYDAAIDARTFRYDYGTAAGRHLGIPWRSRDCEPIMP